MVDIYDKDIDQVFGVEIIGYEWDGLKEFNNLLLKWWFYLFYVIIVWVLIYWVLYFFWLLVFSYMIGVLGFSQWVEVLVVLEEGIVGCLEFVDKIVVMFFEDIL